jgi:sodium transport system permease protein
LFTVMLFSLMTSLLNLLSMGVTSELVISHLPGSGGESVHLGMPPLVSQLWLVLALIPVSALFSALCIALASFARSTKEGQYYLMPLVLVTLPLVILPMGPGMELNLGNSLIPLTGLVLLLRSLLEGNYLAALPYAPLVVAVTLLCCLMAVRWAVEQFNKESVLFRESERLDVGLWLRHLLRDRCDTPSVSEAFFCAVLILLVRFFMTFAMHAPETFADFGRLVVVSQLVVILTPAMLMTVMLTRSPAQTLLLRKPIWWVVPAGALLALALHPALRLFQLAVEQLYPTSPAVQESLHSLEQAPNFWIPLLLVAFIPAVCEELAFRGFILSGFRHLGHKWWAIILSSLIFGVTHMLLQQSIVACVVGAVIGYIAVQSGSIFPAMAFHFTHNGLLLAMMEFQNSELLKKITRPLADGNEFIYDWWLVGVGCIIAGIILVLFAGLSYRKTEEESLQEAIEHQAAGVSA